MRATAEDIIRFWFIEHGEDDWFGGKPEFDAVLAERFSDTHAEVSKGEAYSWRRTAEGRLAEIIVLDQFSRQLFRGKREAFTQDGMALVLAQEAVLRGFDQEVPQAWRGFFYLPYMHSESLAIHEEAMRLYTELGEPNNLDYEIRHQKVIARFGRYPRRNAALGRASTQEETAYIASDDDKF
jgi:uncharacterized protein (DUF924 family)